MEFCQINKITMRKNIISKTVTIAIPAHNEEKNIASLLNSILLQKGNNFKMDKIIVACDGCTDKTSEIVSAFTKLSPMVKLLNDRKRLGKNTRLNKFYADLTSDILISFDADITITDLFLVSKIVAAFNDKKIGLIGGRVNHTSENNFVGKSLLAQEYFWSKVIASITNGNNVHSHTGPISAAKKEFIKKIRIPKDLPDDHFLYFKALENNFSYKYVKDASVFIKTPATLNDYMKQSTRFLSSAQNIKKYFGDWVQNYYYIPYQVKLKAYLITFVKNPVYLPTALMIVSFQRILSFKYLEKNNIGIWTSIETSK